MAVAISVNNRIVSIVDDDPDIAILFYDTLKSIAGITIFTFTDPIQALEHFHVNEHAYVAIISDATASGDKRHYETTLERVRDYYGLVMDTERFKKAIGTLDKVRKGEIDVRTMPEEQQEAFLNEFNLLDPRKFAPEETVL
jgi:hypothetical protein